MSDTVNQATLIMQVAAAEVGYLEKRNGNVPQLFHKTDNAGTQNWTKYWHDLMRSFQSQPWCAAWTSWCARVAGVAESVVPTMFSCTQIRNWARDRGLWHLRANTTPQIGDHVIFTNSAGEIAHIGLVEQVTSAQIHTIEGNTSSGNNTVIANGGGVFRKSYNRTNTRILGYFRPRYVDVSFPADSPFLAEGSRRVAVEDIQRLLNEHGANPVLKVDGSMGPKTREQVDIYRRNNGLMINGVVDVDLWNRLRDGASSVPVPVPIPEPVPTAPIASNMNFSGTSMIARIWNAIVRADVKGISDRPEHIAGIIGNLQSEAGVALCPFQQEVCAKQGLGLMQWSFQRRTDLESFMWNNGINQTAFTAEMNKHLNNICNNVSVHPTDLLDRVLDVQIRFMFHELTNTWERFYLNYVDHPTNRTGVAGARSYAELFCVLSLRPGSGSGTNDDIQDAGVQRARRESDFGGRGTLDRISFSGLATRRNRAAAVYEQFVAQSGSSTPVPSPTPIPTPASDNVHVVVRGDTLSSIARRYNTTVAILMQLNNISNPDVISVGQRIILPGGESAVTPTPTPSQPSFQEYRVRITTATSPLRVRSGPGTNHVQIVIGIEMQVVDRNTVQTIVEERDGWGRLKQTFNGQPGWISLAHTTRI